MEKRYEDLTGLKFGMLTVIKEYDQRIDRLGWSVEKALTEPPRSPKRGDSHG